MPIVTIETLSDQPLSKRDALPTPAQLQVVADELGALFGSQPNGTWVRARQQQRAYYVENNGLVDAGLRPVMVEIQKSDLEPEDQLAAEAASVCSIVARSLGRPERNVHVVYQPAARGRIAFGGKLVR